MLVFSAAASAMTIVQESHAHYPGKSSERDRRNIASSMLGLNVKDP
jgi:hypothetical protein